MRYGFSVDTLISASMSLGQRLEWVEVCGLHLRCEMAISQVLHSRMYRYVFGLISIKLPWPCTSEIYRDVGEMTCRDGARRPDKSLLGTPKKLGWLDGSWSPRTAACCASARVIRALRRQGSRAQLLQVLGTSQGA
jgi:hypothetical protein